MSKVAVVLSGCGHLDGSEIRETVLTLLSLEECELKYQCFAPDTEFIVTDHITCQENQSEKRSIMSEAARITRGEVYNLNTLKVEDFAAIILPGGYGAAKNLSNLATAGSKAKVMVELEKLLIEFWQVKKIIAAICISPALVTAALAQHTSLAVTIGNDSENLIGNLGGQHITCKANDYYYDKNNCILSTPAYMLDAKLNDIAVGINLMIKAIHSEIR